MCQPGRPAPGGDSQAGSGLASSLHEIEGSCLAVSTSTRSPAWVVEDFSEACRSRRTCARVVHVAIGSSLVGEDPWLPAAGSEHLGRRYSRWPGARGQDTLTRVGIGILGHGIDEAVGEGAYGFPVLRHLPLDDLVVNVGDIAGHRSIGNRWPQPASHHMSNTTMTRA